MEPDRGPLKRTLSSRTCWQVAVVIGGRVNWGPSTFSVSLGGLFNFSPWVGFVPNDQANACFVRFGESWASAIKNRVRFVSRGQMYYPEASEPFNGRPRPSTPGCLVSKPGFLRALNQSKASRRAFASCDLIKQSTRGCAHGRSFRPTNRIPIWVCRSFCGVEREPICFKTKVISRSIQKHIDEPPICLRGCFRIARPSFE